MEINNKIRENKDIDDRFITTSLNVAQSLMNTEDVALPQNATVADALEALKQNEDLLESLNTLFLVDEQERLIGVVPLARLFLHQGAQSLATLAAGIGLVAMGRRGPKLVVSV